MASDAPQRNQSEVQKCRSNTSQVMEEERKRSGMPPSAAINGDFIRAGPQESVEIHETQTSRLKSWARRVTNSTYLTQLLAMVICFDAYCNCTDIDARAHDERAPLFFQIGAIVCLLLYTIESMLVVFGQGFSVLKDPVFLIDLGVVLCGYVEVTLDLVAHSEFASSFGIFRLLRLVRVMRLLRLLRKTRALRELQKLVIMMSTCLKTLLWSFVFCFVIMTIWAMLLVELVNPLVQEMARADPSVFGDCEWCMRATKTVMNANLLLFKTVIAGDSWGTIAVPVIEAHPATGIIFVGSLLTLVFGVLNLIVAVVVDTFADARDRDILNLAEEMEQDLEADKRFLEVMFNRIDRDKTGQVTLEQLVEGARRDAEFQSRLRVMDIDEADLVQLFDMIDADGSGYIESHEFIRPLSRWVHDSKTAPRFIKYNLIRTMHQQEEIKEAQKEMRLWMENAFSKLFQTVDGSPLSMATFGGLPERGLTTWEPQITEPMEAIKEEVQMGLSPDERHPPPVPSSSGVEQPKTSKDTTFRESGTTSAALVPPQLERLERLVLDATELALRQSCVMIKSAFSDWSRHASHPKSGPASTVLFSEDWNRHVKSGPASSVHEDASLRNFSKDLYSRESPGARDSRESREETMELHSLPGTTPSQTPTAAHSVGGSVAHFMGAAVSTNSATLRSWRRRPMPPSSHRMLEELHRNIGDPEHPHPPIRKGSKQ